MKCTVLTLFLLPGILTYAQPATDTLTFDSRYPVPEKKKNILLHAGLALGYASATYYCYRKEDNHFQKESQEHKTVLVSGIARGVSPLGESKNAWMAWGATASVAYLTRNTRLQKTVYIWAGSMLINSVATDKLKNSLQRYRPSTGMPFNTFGASELPGMNHSLPSAHTSNAFTTATVFATMYRDKKWVPPLAYGVATMVGLSRIYNNAHWASDVMAGAAVGFLSARTMILTDRWLEKKNIRLYPQVGRKQGAVSMVMNF